MINDVYESTRNVDLTHHSTNFQKFSEVDRFDLTPESFSKESVKRRVKFSSNKLIALSK